MTTWKSGRWQSKKDQLLNYTIEKVKSKSSENKEYAKAEKIDDTTIPERAPKWSKIAKQNVTRVPWLSDAFDYRKEINLEQNWPLWQWEGKGK